MGLKIIWYLFYIQVSENSDIYEKEEKDFDKNFALLPDDDNGKNRGTN